MTQDLNFSPQRMKLDTKTYQRELKTIPVRDPLCVVGFKIPKVINHFRLLNCSQASFYRRNRKGTDPTTKATSKFKKLRQSRMRSPCVALVTARRLIV